MSTATTMQSILLAELIDAMRDGFIVPVSHEDQLVATLAEVDFGDSVGLRRATRSLHAWRMGGDPE